MSKRKKIQFPVYVTPRTEQLLKEKLKTDINMRTRSQLIEQILIVALTKDIDELIKFN